MFAQMFNKNEVQSNIKMFRSYLFNKQWEYEDTNPEKKNLDQAIRLSQRVRTLLDLYGQVLEGRVFDEDYLKQYL